MHMELYSDCKLTFVSSQRKHGSHSHREAVADAAPVAAAAALSSAPESKGSSFYERTNPHKPSAFSATRLSATAPSPSAGRHTFTISIALPGSVILNAQSPELQSRLVAHVARAAAIFNVDEIVVWREGKGARDQAVLAQSGGYGRGKFSKPIGDHGQQQSEWGAGEQGESNGGAGGNFDEDAFLARVLQYLETPQ